MRLFCFTFAGGSASSFFEWRRWSSNLEVIPIEYPGRGTRWDAEPAATVEALTGEIAADLPLSLHDSYALFGHSFGGIVAFEVTRLIIKSGQFPPVSLCLSGIRAPQLQPREKIHGLPDQEFLAKLIDYGGMPPEVLADKDLLSLVMPIVRDDFRLYEEYAYCADDVLPIPISVYGGLKDAAVPMADLLAWRQHTTKSFRCHFYDGGHFFLYEPRFSVVDDVQGDINASATAVAQGDRTRYRGDDSR